MTVFSRRYALLGLGDVALPSLLVAFLGRYGDARGETIDYGDAGGETGGSPFA